MRTSIRKGRIMILDIVPDILSHVWVSGDGTWIYETVGPLFVTRTPYDNSIVSCTTYEDLVISSM